MSFINIFIQNSCKLYVKNNQLVLDGKEKMDWPLEDINAIMIESRDCVVTTYALSELSKNKIVVYFCDEKHQPCSFLLPYNEFFQPLKIQKLQLEMEKPLQKKLWQSIVKQKIINQAFVLKDINLETSKELQNLAGKVKSNDADNVEAISARKYFGALFGPHFSRKNESAINACLNYGYAILRGAISRSVVVHGLNPNFGLFHKSTLNVFNLADDLIEPFRAVVDLFVVQHLSPEIEELTPAIKHKLFNLLNVDVLIENLKQPIKVAVERMVETLCLSIESGETKLALPSMLELENHFYE